jgi:hypothetical protein
MWMAPKRKAAASGWGTAICATLTPLPSGCRYVDTHNMSMSDLNRGAFTGQFAFAYVEPQHDPGAYDQQIFLATHE